MVVVAPAHFGKTEPRLWTSPLRPLTRETSRGFEVIDFAVQVLGIVLYPWQQWVLIHALELLEDETYRFRRIIILVARQNGKTLLITVLAAWWLFVESRRRPDKVRPPKFKIVGTAQNLDIASGPWKLVKQWCNPKPDTAEEAALIVPMLQAETQKIVDTNGQEQIIAKNLAHYETRAVKSARGKAAARVIMDELREHTTWHAWNAVSQTAKSFFDGQVWGISNAGDPSAIVLSAQRDRGIELIEEWDRLVGAGIQSVEEYCADPDHDLSLALFDYSAPDDCELTDVDAILQANPSIGYGEITVADCLSDSRTMPDADYRTEVLCQWVKAKVKAYIDVRKLEKTYKPAAWVAEHTVRGARTVWGVDTSADRKMTYVSAATTLDDGRVFTRVWAQRAGMMWLPEYLTDLARKSGHWEVAVQSKGTAAMEFVEPLQKAGFTVHKIDGSTIGIATGRFRDAIEQERMVTVDQPVMRLAIVGGVTSKYAENDAWSRTKSQTDVAPAIASTVALYGLEVLRPEHQPVGKPPTPAVLDREPASDSDELNVVDVHF